MGFHLFTLSMDLVFGRIEKIYYAKNIFYPIAFKPREDHSFSKPSKNEDAIFTHS